jgi:uncharacterized membrane protein
MAIHGHPVHPMLIHFPVAALLGVIATDVAYAVTADLFWARAGFWLVTVGVCGGWISSFVGFADLMLVARIRCLITAWCHAVLAVMLLSLASFNWMLRWGDTALHILPWGLAISLLSGLIISVTSYLGGRLVYEQAVGVDTE